MTGKKSISASIDHVIPVSKGGVNARSNLVLCCMKCNLVKGNICMEENIEVTAEIEQR